MGPPARQVKVSGGSGLRLFSRPLNHGRNGSLPARMLILGVYSGNHDASACLFDDYRLLSRGRAGTADPGEDRRRPRPGRGDRRMPGHRRARPRGGRGGGAGPRRCFRSAISAHLTGPQADLRRDPPARAARRANTWWPRACAHRRSDSLAMFDGPAFPAPIWASGRKPSCFLQSPPGPCAADPVPYRLAGGAALYGRRRRRQCAVFDPPLPRRHSIETLYGGDEALNGPGASRQPGPGLWLRDPGAGLPASTAMRASSRASRAYGKPVSL